MQHSTGGGAASQVSRDPSKFKKDYYGGALMVIFGLAAAYAGAGETGTAVDFGEAAYGLAPANPAVVDAYGWALFRGGDKDGALELLQKAVILAPRHPGLRWHLAQVYAALGRKAEAKQHAQAALADPGFTERAAAQAMAKG